VYFVVGESKSATIKILLWKTAIDLYRTRRKTRSRVKKTARIYLKNPTREDHKHHPLVSFVAYYTASAKPIQLFGDTEYRIVA
jgi:hypothetical protein